ncbi:hypothetical protein [Bacteroides sp. 224]|uniref:hypothetical protein n=1 Tax=Bacteroides sp. 224 TaxID=2302936 RepID=UPI0013D61D7B|nr:hypothetical protein [Bacteroides sp. 224]NDV63991.1 hypothetical protein [Bacteroides sp. 224]
MRTIEQIKQQILEAKNTEPSNSKHSPLWYPNPWEFQWMWKVPVWNDSKPGGNDIELISEMKSVNYDFNDFNDTIESLLKLYMFECGYRDEIENRIDTQCDAFSEFLYSPDEDWWIPMQKSELEDLIKEQLVRLILRWSCSDDEVKQIYQQLVKVLTSDSDCIREYEKYNSQKTLEEVAENVAAYMTGDGCIERYFLDGPNMGVSWMTVGNNRTIDMDETWEVFCNELKSE